MIVQSIDHLNTTVNYISEIIEVTQNTNLNKSLVDLNSVVEDISKAFQYELNTFDFKTDIKDCTILAEPAYINSILENLISNAIKYARQDSKRIEVNIHKEIRDCIIAVKDYGRGIDMKQYGDKIFDMFATFHSNKESKGLGLFLVKKYVESMKGEISVDSILNQETTFTIKKYLWKND